MGYYCAWGDAKMKCSSEEEGYENRVIVDVAEKRGGRASDTHGEAPPTPAPPIADDTDRQFWAEDELSSSESRQRLTARRKRRRSVSYRNRAANMSQSRAPRPSNSSSDSIHAETSAKVCRIRRRWLNPKTEKLQLGKASCTSTEEPICMVNKVIASEHQAASTSSSRLESREAILPRANHCERASNTLRDVKRIRPKKARGPSFFYSIKRKRLWFVIYSLR
ncbi:PREDICTED: uncharacterized protein LOC105456849 [Wasmannia auropunctata]|uniref:uncharacterized protein LOC105456849 n=1 Tax=Wasmannia auropunctata TaxID=64793 RepID=UPI0005EDFC4E|nr:PREDICTED: uncharacterized protein LOC105456849 [Wasmannia auropunctata]